MAVGDLRVCCVKISRQEQPRISIPHIKFSSLQEDMFGSGISALNRGYYFSLSVILCLFAYPQTHFQAKTLVLVAVLPVVRRHNFS